MRNFFIPCGITVDRSNNIYVLDDSFAYENRGITVISNSPTLRQLKLTGTNWNVTTVDDLGGFRGF